VETPIDKNHNMPNLIKDGTTKKKVLKNPVLDEFYL